MTEPLTPPPHYRRPPPYPPPPPYEASPSRVVEVAARVMPLPPPSYFPPAAHPLPPEQFYRKFQSAIQDEDWEQASTLMSAVGVSQSHADLAFEAVIEADSSEGMKLLMKFPCMINLILNLQTIDHLLQMTVLRDKKKIIEAIPDIYRNKVGRKSPRSPVFINLLNAAIRQNNYEQVKLLCELNRKMAWGLVERECDRSIWHRVHDVEMLQILEEYYPSRLQRLCSACIYAAGEGDLDTLLNLLEELRLSSPEEDVRSPIGAVLEKAVLNGRENIILALCSILHLDDGCSLVRKPTPAEIKQAFLIAIHKKSLTLVQILMNACIRHEMVPSSDELKLLIVEARRQMLESIAVVLSEHYKE